MVPSLRAMGNRTGIPQGEILGLTSGEDNGNRGSALIHHEGGDALRNLAHRGAGEALREVSGTGDELNGAASENEIAIAARSRLQLVGG